MNNTAKDVPPDLLLSIRRVLKTVPGTGAEITYIFSVPQILMPESSPHF